MATLGISGLASDVSVRFAWFERRKITHLSYFISHMKSHDCKLRLPYFLSAAVPFVTDYFLKFVVFQKIFWLALKNNIIFNDSWKCFESCDTLFLVERGFSETVSLWEGKVVLYTSLILVIVKIWSFRERLINRLLTSSRTALHSQTFFQTMKAPVLVLHFTLYIHLFLHFWFICPFTHWGKKG